MSFTQTILNQRRTLLYESLKKHYPKIVDNSINDDELSNYFNIRHEYLNLVRLYYEMNK